MKIKSMSIESASGTVLELADVDVETLAVFDAILNGHITGKVKTSHVTTRDADLPEPNTPRARVPNVGMRNRGATLTMIQFMAKKADQACTKQELVSYIRRQGWERKAAESSIVYGVGPSGYMRETSQGNYLLTKKGRDRAMDPRLVAAGGVQPETRTTAHVHAGEGVIEQGS